MKKFLLVVVSVACSVCLLLISFEIYLRTYNPQTTLARAQSLSFNCFSEGKMRWIKLIPNKSCILSSPNHYFPTVEVKTNSLGLRNPEVSKKEADKKRILFVGDSFIMGWGVPEEKAIPRITESFINANGQQAEVINAGFAASGLSGYYLFLKQNVPALQPDLVVVGVTIGNDITSRLDVEWVEKDEQGLPTVIRSKSTYVDSEGRLRRTVLPIEYRIPYLRDLHSYVFLASHIANVFGVHDQNKQSNGLAFDICVYKESCKELAEEYEQINRLFLGMKQITDQYNSTLVFLLIPTEFQVRNDVFDKYRLPMALLPNDQSYPNRRIAQFLTEQQIGFLDLQPILKEYTNEKLYFQLDDHWNEQGHLRSAEAVASMAANILYK